MPTPIAVVTTARPATIVAWSAKPSEPYECASLRRKSTCAFLYCTSHHGGSRLRHPRPRDRHGRPGWSAVFSSRATPDAGRIQKEDSCLVDGGSLRCCPSSTWRGPGSSTAHRREL